MVAVMNTRYETAMTTHPNKAKSYHSKTFPITPAIVCIVDGSLGISGVAGPSAQAKGIGRFCI